MILAPTPIVFPHEFSLVLLRERGSLLFCNAVTESCVYPVISFFSSALHGGPEDETHDTKGASSLAASVVLFLDRAVFTDLYLMSYYSPSFKVVSSNTSSHIWPTI